MSDATFQAKLYPNEGLTIDTLNGGKNTTPGNVGVCLSGGGSRALTSGMGQLRALNYLTTSDGKSLLSQTKALSTVSGGSWLGITMEMQNKYDLESYLNSYVPDPASLTTKSIGSLPEGNIGQCVTSNFSIEDIALQAFIYYAFSKTPASMLWQTVIAKHILAPYGLYDAGQHQAPTQAFTYNDDSKNNILNISDQNQSLKETDFLTLSKNSIPQYFICNTSMFVEGAEPSFGDYQYLAPVQCTPFFTGIVSSPDGVDANGKKPGGGGVTSFAFNSELQSISDSTVSINQQRPWSILDCIGASSSAFSESLVNLFAKWQKNPVELLSEMKNRGHNNLSKTKPHLNNEEYDHAHSWLSHLLDLGLDNEIAKFKTGSGSLESILTTLVDGLVPKYYYWPVEELAVEQTVKPSMFADGGNLENTGIASLLSYSDIDNVIAFVNSPTPLSPAKTSGSVTPPVTVNQDTQVITTDIIIDSQMPPLFGYQPCENGQYIPYESGENISKSTASGVHNQVFPCSAFADFLLGIWGAAEGSKAPAIYKQTTEVLENSWFGVPARNSLTCVWVYLNDVSDWNDQLDSDVKKTLKGIDNFPNYKTSHTELNASEINLLSSMTAWSVGNDNNKSIFIDLFKD